MSTVRRALALGCCLFWTAGSAIAEDEHPRIRPLPEAEWSPEVRTLLLGTYDQVAELEGKDAPSKPKTLNILRTIAHNPNLLGPFLDFASAIAREGALSRRDHEILALRAAWNCKSDFEWGHHVVFAKAAGMSDDEISQIAIGPEAKGWSKDDRALLLAADQLHARQQIDDAVWQQISSRYDEAQLVEIPFVVGQYTMLSMVANATGVELEAGHDPIPEIEGASGPE
jgi:4-carboxymuconolactone decarboxylase